MAANRPQSVREQAEERRLVEAAQRDPVRFGDLYELHFERIYVFILRRVRDPDIAEDLTSEVFHKALANLPDYEWRGTPFVVWLIRIASNAVNDQMKRAAREVEAPEDIAGDEADLAAIEDGARLFRLADQLPADQRHVIFERFVEQRSIKEIAAEMQRSEGAVKQLQFRALESLRDQMEGAHG